jgi:hypothetical protein
MYNLSSHTGGSLGETCKKMQMWGLTRHIFNLDRSILQRSFEFGLEARGCDACGGLDLRSFCVCSRAHFLRSGGKGRRETKTETECRVDGIHSFGERAFQQLNHTRLRKCRPAVMESDW